MMYTSKLRANSCLFSSVHDSSTMALWKAAHQQDTEGVALALRNGADVNAWDENGDTPLHLAAFANNTDMISVLTEAPKVNIDKGDEFGRTPLYIAVDVRAKQAAKALLVAGANPNEGDLFAKTPLHAAAFSGRLDIVKLLLQNGADVNAQDHSGEQPLTVAFLTSPQPSLARLLLRFGADIDTTDLVGQGLLSQAIYNCCCRSDRDAVAFLLRRGADVNFREEVSQWTPLHAAALVNDAGLVQMLIDAGANLLAKDASGMKPLDIAVLAENMTAARELRKHYSPEFDMTAHRNSGEQYVSPNIMYL